MKIALTGKLRSGKDTVAEYLINKHGFVPFAFGNKLKEEFHRKYPQVPEYPKPRKGYQLYGQLMRYVYGEDFWLDLCFNDINYTGFLAKGYNSEIEYNPVITDVRQLNEFARVEKEGYILIKVLAREDIRLERARQAGDFFGYDDMRHETESYIDQADSDFIIVNNGTMEKLYETVDLIIDRIKEREQWSK
jgi:dephospho-CoA kinase